MGWLKGQGCRLDYCGLWTVMDRGGLEWGWVREWASVWMGLVSCRT